MLIWLKSNLHFLTPELANLMNNLHLENLHTMRNGREGARRIWGKDWMKSGLWALLLSVMVGCSVEPERVEWESVDMEKLEPVSELRIVDREIWTRKAISYSGFRAGQSPSSGLLPSHEEIVEDLKLLVSEGFGLIRVYGSIGHGSQVVELIDRHQLDLKVQLGAYVKGSDAENHDANMLELLKAIELANKYPETVMAVSVGNEVLVSWSFVAIPPADLAGYIRFVRGNIKQPVTVNDNWEPFAKEPGSPQSKVWGQIDYASVHTYAYWDAAFNLWDFRQEAVPLPARAKATIAAAAAYAVKNFQAVRQALDAAGYRIPIVIGETGWQNLPSAILNEAQVKDFAQHLAHPVNQSWYFAAMMSWAYGPEGGAPGDGFERPSAMFYFAAFDEPWKQADDNWGLWDAERKEKFVLSGEGFGPEDAVYWRP